MRFDLHCLHIIGNWQDQEGRKKAKKTPEIQEQHHNTKNFILMNKNGSIAALRGKFIATLSRGQELQGQHSYIDLHTYYNLHTQKH